MKITKKAKDFSWLLLLLIIVISFASLFLTIRKTHSSQTERPLYTVKTFKIDENKWGYFIFKDNKIIIKQDIIPVMQQNIPFHSEDDAKKTGQMVLQKLNNHELPTLTSDDLNSLNLVY